MNDVLNARTIPEVILDHAERISSLEKGQGDMDKRLDNVEKKIDKVIVLEWGAIIAVVASIIATHIHF